MEPGDYEPLPRLRVLDPRPIGCGKPDRVGQAIRLVKLKGHTVFGQRLLLLVNPSESETTASFRVGIESADLTRARYDFVPSGTAPARYVTKRLERAAPPVEYGGLPRDRFLRGRARDRTDVRSSGYVAMVASGGPDSNRNVVGLREHPNPASRGLRLFLATQQRYPDLPNGYGAPVRHTYLCATVTPNFGKATLRQEPIVMEGTWLENYTQR